MIVFPDYSTTLGPPSAQVVPQDDPILSGFDAMLKAATRSLDQYEQKKKVRERTAAIADTLDMRGKTLEANIYRNIGSTASMDLLGPMGSSDLEAINDKLFADAMDIAKIDTAFGQESDAMATKMRHDLDILEKDYDMKLNLSNRDKEFTLERDALNMQHDLDLEGTRNDLILSRDAQQRQNQMDTEAKKMALEAVSQGLIEPSDAAKINTFEDLLSVMPTSTEAQMKFIERAANQQYIMNMQHKAETQSQIDRMKSVREEGIPGSYVSPSGNVGYEEPDLPFGSISDFLDLANPNREDTQASDSLFPRP